MKCNQIELNQFFPGFLGEFSLLMTLWTRIAISIVCLNAIAFAITKFKISNFHYSLAAHIICHIDKFSTTKEAKSCQSTKLCAVHDFCHLLIEFPHRSISTCFFRCTTFRVRQHTLCIICCRISVFPSKAFKFFLSNHIDSIDTNICHLSCFMIVIWVLFSSPLLTHVGRISFVAWNFLKIQFGTNEIFN